MKLQTKKDNEIYMHINNGGITFKIIDKKDGPVLKMEITHFGCTTNGMKIPTDKYSLLALSDFFHDASITCKHDDLQGGACGAYIEDPHANIDNSIKCPHCSKMGAITIGEGESCIKGKTYLEVEYQCVHCKHEWEVKEQWLPKPKKG